MSAIWVLFSIAAFIALVGFALKWMRAIVVCRENAARVEWLTRKRDGLQEALRRASEATAAKEMLLSNVSHELRTPLNAILNLPNALRQNFTTVDGVEKYVGDHAELFRMIGFMHAASTQLVTVVQDIGSYGSLESSDVKLSLAHVRVGEIMARVSDTLMPWIEKKQLKWSLETDMNDVIFCDPNRIVQVLLNLVSNSIKFTEEGGRIEVAARKTSDGWDCAVTDTGIGIAEEHHEIIFESFRQVNVGPTRKHGGTGLGLAIAKKLVELHHGTIGVKSALGEGSTFHFSVKTAVESQTT